MKTLNVYNELKKYGEFVELKSLFEYTFNKDYSRLVITLLFNEAISPADMLSVSEVIRENNFKSSLQTTVIDPKKWAVLYIEDTEPVLIEKDGIKYEQKLDNSISWNEFQTLKNE